MRLGLAGSVSTIATSPGSSAWVSASTSLNCAIRTRPVTPLDSPRSRAATRSPSRSTTPSSKWPW
jgi:hypothetical protein